MTAARLIIAACLIGAALAGQRSYKGYRVLETDVLTWEQSHTLRQIEDNTVDFDFWKSANPGRKAKVMSSPDNLAMLETLLQENNIGFQVSIEDVQLLVDQSNVEDKMARQKPSSRYNMDWTSYHSHDDLNEFIDEYAATYSYAETVSIGMTEGGRDMRMLQLTKGGAGKKNVLIEAGIHAREWIAPAVGTYIIKELVENYDAHPQYLDELNFHFIPSANPDGYEYSRSDDRFWRKNREVNPGSICVGTDLNRNWPYHWDESGVSHNPCGDTYDGETALSTKEAQHLSAYFLDLSPTPELSVCLHSAADLWLYPYGYAYNSYPDNVNEIRDVCERAVVALNAVNNDNVDFECINSAELYPAAGASDDWYQSEGSRFTYTPELRDNGYGFVLPPNQIIPSGEEVWAAFEVMLDEILEN